MRCDAGGVRAISLLARPPTSTIPHRLLGGEAKRNHRKPASTQGRRPSGAGETGACVARAPAGAPFVLKRCSGGSASLHHRGGGGESWGKVGRASRLRALVLSGRRAFHANPTHKSS